MVFHSLKNRSGGRFRRRGQSTGHISPDAALLLQLDVLFNVLKLNFPTVDHFYFVFLIHNLAWVQQFLINQRDYLATCTLI